MPDDDREMEEIKKRKVQQVEERKKIEEKLKTTLRAVLEDDAYQRLMNVRLANQQMFMAASQHIIAIFKKFGRKLTEREIIMILIKLKESEEKETKITFARK